MELISNHTFYLANYLYKNLISLHHANGKPTSVVYNSTNFENASIQGGIVNFNLLRDNGEFIGYAEVS